MIPASPLEAAKILLVDDRRDNLLMLDVMLRGVG
jgi:CheY-like chemotaxis protein